MMRAVRNDANSNQRRQHLERLRLARLRYPVLENVDERVTLPEQTRPINLCALPTQRVIIGMTDREFQNGISTCQGTEVSRI